MDGRRTTTSIYMWSQKPTKHNSVWGADFMLNQLIESAADLDLTEKVVMQQILIDDVQFW